MRANMITRTLRVSFLSLILAMIVMVFMTGGVSAQVAGSHQGALSAPSQSKLLHIAIEKVSGQVNYVPNQVNSKVNQTLIITNKTKVSQIMTINNGQRFAKIPAGGQTSTTCGEAGTYVFSLKSNPSATLTEVCS